MARIRPLEAAEVGPSVNAIYDEFFRLRGNVPNMMKTMAHVPRLLETGVSHFKAAMAPGAVDARLKELLAVRVSQINRCDY